VSGCAEGRARVRDPERKRTGQPRPFAKTPRPLRQRRAEPAPPEGGVRPTSAA
jgi:hypothetical protein